MDDLRFHVADYVVMALFLLISSAIGIYYGFFKKQSTTEEYLLGGRQMHLFPVALSLLVTYQSAISVLGIPVEVYLYNIMNMYLYIAICIANMIQATMIVPLVYPLKLTSTYEYLGRRFRSRSVQLLGTIIGMLQTILYMSVVLLAPALALEAVAGIPLWLSIIIIGLIGTVYTSIGGMRTVIWTDVFQFVVLYGGLTVILVMGGIKIGSFTKIFELSYHGKRTAFNEISADPRVRHTVWGLLFAGVFQWLPNCCNQSAVQRISSMRSEKDAKISSYLTIPLMLMYGMILNVTGLLLYAYFANVECGPIAAGKVGNANQMMPYFVMHVLNDIPGLGGIFIAALFSGALSSLSSGINAMAANTLQDILVNCIQHITQRRKTLIAQCIVFVYGIFAVIIAYMARNLSGPVTQMALSAFGSAGGPVAGIFFLGAIFPQANWIGAFTGGIISIAINMWIAVSSFMYSSPSPKSPPLPTTGCDSNSTSVVNTLLHINSTQTWMNNSAPGDFALTSSTPSMSPDEGHFALYDMSYAYFGLLGFLLTMVIGLLVSMLTGKDRGQPPEAEYIFPFLRNFWKLERNTMDNQLGSYAIEVTKNGNINLKEEFEGDGMYDLLQSVEMEVTLKTTQP